MHNTKKLLLTSLGSCLVQNPKAALTTTHGITALDHVTCSAITAAIFDTSHYGKGSGGCWACGCGIGGVHYLLVLQ